MTRWFLVAITSIVAFVLSSVAAFFVSYTTLYLAAIPIGACIASLVFACIAMSEHFDATKGCELRSLIIRLREAAVGVGEKPTLIEIIFLSAMYVVYVLIDPIGNLIRLYLTTSSEDKRKSNNSVDLFVITLLVVSVVAYFLSPEAHEWWLASFYVWLVLDILFHKLKEIADIAQPSLKGDVTSKLRTVILSLLNIVELLFAYAFLYRYFGVIEKNTFLNGLFFAFKVFTTQGVDETMVIQYESQRVLLISQFSVLLIVLAVFVGNMFSIQDERRKK